MFDESTKKEPLIPEKDMIDTFFEQINTSRVNPISIGIYGADGTAKSGIVMDCRTDEEKQQGKKIIIFDLDLSNANLKANFHNNDENIILLNPWTITDGKIDYVKTYMKLLGWINLIPKKFKPDEIKVVSIDSLDNLLEICKNAMKEEMGIGHNKQIEIKDWELRNEKYNAVFRATYSLSCIKVFITHLKERMTFQNGLQYSTIMEPEWHRSTPNFLHLTLLCERTEINKDNKTIVEFSAVVKKSKIGLSLEGKKINVALIIQEKNKEPMFNWDNNIFKKILNKQKW